MVCKICYDLKYLGLWQTRFEIFGTVADKNPQSSNLEPIDISIGAWIQDPRVPPVLPTASWILDLGSRPRLKFQSVQSGSKMVWTRLSGTLGSWIQARIEISIGFNRDSSVLDLLTLSWREGEGGFLGGTTYMCIHEIHKSIKKGIHIYNIYMCIPVNP